MSLFGHSLSPSRALSLALLALCLAPAAALAAATPVSPAADANVGPNTHPAFSWALPPGEESELLYIASKPDITPEGKFFTENVVDSKAFMGSETTYTAETAIPAGRYWWTIRTHDKAFTSLYSPPISFSIAPQITSVATKVTRYSATRRYGVDVTAAGNVSSARITVRVLRGGKVVGRATQVEKYSLIGEPSTRFIVVQVRRGTPRRGRFKLVTTVQSGAAKVTNSKSVRKV